METVNKPWIMCCWLCPGLCLIQPLFSLFQPHGKCLVGVGWLWKSLHLDGRGKSHHLLWNNYVHYLRCQFCTALCISTRLNERDRGKWLWIKGYDDISSFSQKYSDQQTLIHINQYLNPQKILNSVQIPSEENTTPKLIMNAIRLKIIQKKEKKVIKQILNPRTRTLA